MKIIHAYLFRSGDARRSDGKQIRSDSIKEIARMMALSDGSTLPSTRLEPGEEERVVSDNEGSDEVVQPHVPQQQQQVPNFTISFLLVFTSGKYDEIGYSYHNVF